MMSQTSVSKKHRTFHVKTLLIINIFLTSAILISGRLIESLLILLTGLVSFIIFYGVDKLNKYFQIIVKFKTLFITLILFQLLLRRQGEILFEWYFIKITDIGFFFAFNSLSRYFVILLSALMLGNASIYQIIKALRTWKIPEIFIIVASFTIQFLRQLQVDFKILNNNLKKRNITFKGMPFKKRFELAAHLIVSVIGSLFSGIKYKVIAMELNGYTLHKNVKPFRYTKCDLFDYLLMVSFFITMIAILYM